MFNPDFFPTPKDVIERMLQNVIVSGKVVLEPSAGKGNIVDHLNYLGAKEVIACEIERDLRSILNDKCRVIEANFLNVESVQVSHIDMIVMNPPFSVMEEHILHAWKIAPAGCDIITLCNESLLKNAYSKTRREIEGIVKLNGSFEHFGDCFRNSERNTGVNVSCIRMHKPNEEGNEFDGFFDLSEDEEEKCDVPGLMSYNYVRDIVGRYVDAVNMFEFVLESNQRMNNLISPIDKHTSITFGAFNMSRDGRNQRVDRDTFKKELQKSAWKSIFSKFDIGKFVTTGVMENLNKFVEQQVHVPFTMKNVYKMIEMIIGTSESRMNQVLVEAFERICSFSSENSTAGEKWKTNSDYMINKRFIMPYVCKYDTRWPSAYVTIDYSADNRLDDIIKGLCTLTGRNYDEVMLMEYVDNYGRKDTTRKTLSNFFRNEDKKEWGQWHEWTFFRVRGYKKGTMHFEFLDEQVLEMFNRRVAEIKGWRLPKSTKKSYRAKTEGVTIFA